MVLTLCRSDVPDGCSVVTYRMAISTQSTVFRQPVLWTEQLKAFGGPVEGFTSASFLRSSGVSERGLSGGTRHPISSEL